MSSLTQHIGKTQADGALVFSTKDIEGLPVIKLKNFHLSIEKNTASAGTLALEMKLRGCSNYEPWLDGGVDVVVLPADLTKAAHYTSTGDIESIRVTPTGIIGAYNVILSVTV